MTKGQKIGIVIGGIAISIIIGISIYSSTKKSVDNGSQENEESEPEQKPMPKLVKQNPDGSQVWENPDGKIVTYTKEQVKSIAAEATKGRGADGWAS